MIACGRGRPPGHAAAAHCAIRAPASGLPAPRWRAAPAVATATRHVGGAVADGSFPPDARAYSGHSASSSASREEPSLHRRGGRDVCARVGKRSRGTGWGGRRSQPGAGDFRVAGEPIGRETALYRRGSWQDHLRCLLYCTLRATDAPPTGCAGADGPFPVMPAGSSCDSRCGSTRSG